MSQAIEFSSNIDEQLSRWLGAIPILLPILQRLNVVPIINRYCRCEADVDEGTVALIMALNRLMSPRPLPAFARTGLQGGRLDGGDSIGRHSWHFRRETA